VVYKGLYNKIIFYIAGERIKMTNTEVLKKGLVVCAVLLFVGVAVGPSITCKVVRAESDNDFIEVTSQACGIKGFGNQTVKLTKQQYQDLEKYLNEFREKLNKTTSRDEAVPIFKEAVVELNKYGLLPKGMNVEQGQKLVTGLFQNKNVMKLEEKLLHNYLFVFDNNSNLFCLTIGSTSNISFFGLPYRPLLNSFNLVLIRLYIYDRYNLITPIFTEIAYFFIDFILIGIIYPYQTIPINIRNYIMFGDQGRFYSHPSDGWVDTYGLLGKKHWNGSFFGNLFPIGWGQQGDWEAYWFGAAGFTGITISNQQNDKTFFLGTTLHIKLNSNPSFLFKK
jgi:hypothetical protein